MTASAPECPARTHSVWPEGHLAIGSGCRHHRDVPDDEATQLMLETLFDIRATVKEIHEAVVEPEDDDEETEEDA
jgi:hypothetical protein